MDYKDKLKKKQKMVTADMILQYYRSERLMVLGAARLEFKGIIYSL